MNNSDCPSFEGCKAPLCPMDDSFKNGAIWYANEDICGALKYRKDKWRVNQRKIAKLNSKYPVTGYFDIDMLKIVKRVGKGIRGLKYLKLRKEHQGCSAE
ncbi:MAG: hypothetical protein ABR886_01330 [Dehalococcoidales bacterium]|jgi:hypothetical protein